MTGARRGRERGSGGARIAPALLLALSMAVLLSACPSVDLSRWWSDSSDNTGATAAGPVAGFGSGSVKAAGAEFTDNVSTTVADDRGRGIGGIVAGMVVTVRGTIDAEYESGAATSIAIEREVRGPVDGNGVALDNATIRVLGQTVVVNPATVILDASGGDIELDDLKGFLDDGYLPGLEVHGSAEDNGTLHASYIGWVQDNVADDDGVELRGTVKGFDGAAYTFFVGAQKVNYKDLPAGGKVDWPGTGLADGLVVDVRGYIDAVGGAGTVRTDRAGDRVQVIDVDLGDSQDRVALEGYVLSGSSSSFVMSVPGGTVTVNSGNASSGDAFGPRKRVRVRGKLGNAAGATVQAASVVVLPPFAALLEGAPEDLPADGDTITLLGKTVETDGYTMFRDPSGGFREGFGLATLASGDIVRVVGWLDNSSTAGKIEAVRLDRIDGTAGRVGVQGPVTSFVGVTSMSILGLTVNTNGADIDYFDKDGVAFASRSAFYDALSAGTVVRVRNGVFVSASSRIDAPSGGGTMEIRIVTVNR